MSKNNDKKSDTKKLVALISTEGKSEEQIKQELKAAYQKFLDAAKPKKTS